MKAKESGSKISFSRVSLRWLTPLALLPVAAVIVLFLSLQPVWEAYQVQDFLSRLDKAGPDEWEHTVASLVTVHEDIIKPLSDWTRSSSVERRIKAVTLLAQLPSEQVNPILLEALKDDDVRVWKRAETSLVRRWQRTDDPSINALFDHGLLLLRNREWEKARRIFDLIINHETPLPAELVAEAYCQRAETFYQEKDFHHCLRDCQEALRLNPNHFGALLFMGMCYHHERNLILADDAYRRALDIHPHLDSAQKMVEIYNKARENARALYAKSHVQGVTQSTEELPLHIRRVP